MNGFLGTGATFRADLNLVLQIVMGMGLLFGWWLARRKNFRAHMFCQSTVMLVNLLLIVTIMFPAFRRQVSPQIPANLNDIYYSIAAIHAGLGVLAELIGIYIVLVAATGILPESLKFKNYKRWMRLELGLWWVVLLFGFGTYYYWYLAPSIKMPVTSRSTAPSSSRVTVKITNFSFEPKEITIPAGSTVEWIDERGKHSVAADDGSFESVILDAGGRFERSYLKPGIYPYYCPLHGNKGGVEMAGVVKVTE